MEGCGTEFIVGNLKVNFEEMTETLENGIVRKINQLSTSKEKSSKGFR